MLFLQCERYCTSTKRIQMMQTCGEMVLDWVWTLKASLSLQQMYKAFLMCFLGSHKDFYQNYTSVFRIGHSKIDLLCLIVFALLCSVVLCQCCCLCQYFEFQFLKNQVESKHWSDTESVENGLPLLLWSLLNLILFSMSVVKAVK